jgi:hypothetical protein
MKDPTMIMEYWHWHKYLYSIFFNLSLPLDIKSGIIYDRPINKDFKNWEKREDFSFTYTNYCRNKVISFTLRRHCSGKSPGLSKLPWEFQSSIWKI